jgi:hypothetical protein
MSLGKKFDSKFSSIQGYHVVMEQVHVSIEQKWINDSMIGLAYCISHYALLCFNARCVLLVLDSLNNKRMSLFMKILTWT